MRTYDKYKNSAIEWVGDIPEHWKVSKLKFTGRSIIGLTYSPEEIVDDESGYLVLRSSNIQNGLLSLSDNVYVKKEIDKQLILQEGDILICARNGSADLVGKNIMIDKAMAGQTFGAFMTVFRGRQNHFVYWFLNSPFFDAQKGAFSTSTINQLTSNILNNLLITLPTSEEQISIATYLDIKITEIDQTIADKEALINLFEEEKKALINEAVTKGLNPKVKLKPSGVDWLGDIPEHWEITRLKYVGHFVNGYAFDSNEFCEQGIRVIKISNIQHMEMDWSDESYIDESYYEKLPAFRVQKGDLVFALTRPIISSGIKAAIINTDEKLLVNQRNAVLKPTNRVINGWLYNIILTQGFIEAFDSKIDKSGQQPNISTDKIANIGIPLPSIEEQSAIVQYIETETSNINEKISLIKQEIELLKEYRQALIFEAVTGKICVL